MASSRMKIQMKFKIEGDFIDIVTKGTWAAICCLRRLTRRLELVVVVVVVVMVVGYC